MSETNETITKPKRGRGRPKGTNAYTTVTIEQLTKVFGPTARIPISRGFAQEQGMTGDTGKVADINRLLSSSPSKVVGEEIDLDGPTGSGVKEVDAEPKIVGEEI